jgi:phosphatidylglycerophosphate synthase
MLRKHLYPKIEPTLNKAVGFLAQKKITPNQLTLAGLAVTFLAGWAYSGGLFFLGALLLGIGSLGDILDGPLARLTGKASRFGAFLDSTVDRYADFFLFGGLAYFFAFEERWGSFFMVWGILLGAFVTSYAKARGENFIPSVSVGVFERPERLIGLGLGTLLPPLLPLCLGILLIGTQATALQRIFFVRKSLVETQSSSN